MVKLVRRAVVALVVGGLGLLVMVGDVGSSPVAAQTGTAPSNPTASCPAPPQNMRPRFTPPAHASGTIAAINGATFTVTGKNNSTSTVTTDGNTHYDKLVNSSVGAIAVGDLIMAQGTTPSAGNFAATAIVDNGKPMQRMMPANNAPKMGTRPAGTPRALPAGCKPPPRPNMGMGMNGQQGTHAFGIVQSINGTTLTIGFPKGGKTVTVTTDGNTKVTAHQSGSFADLKVGDRVSAVAARNSGAASNATSFTAAVVSDQTAH